MKKQRAQIYDKILKENLESAVLPLLQRYMGITILESKPIAEALHSTIKREADYLRIVLTDTGEEFILHIEFQSTNDRQMLYRVAEYDGFLRRKYPNLPIRHFVVYIGSEEPSMITQLEENLVFKGFQLVNIHKIDYTAFLQSQIPEEIILGVLSDFGKEPPEVIIRLILRRLKQLSNNENDLHKYLDQLNLLSQARKLDSLTAKTIKEMPITIDIRENALYKEAIELGLKEGMEEGIKKGMEKGELRHSIKAIGRVIERFPQLSDAEVADLLAVSVELVEQVRRGEAPEI